MATVPKKKLQMRFATREDAPRIAEIHMAAFKHNTMLHAQFPTPAVRRGLQVAIENKALADIDDPKASVLVVTSSEDPEKTGASSVVAFAKWSHPVRPDEDYVEPPWEWPEGTDHQTLGAWMAKAWEIERRSCVGDVPYYHLTYIGTDPAHSHCGAGHLLMQWGIEQCDASRSPLYLESTVEAVPFYHKYGFIRGETIALPVRPDGGAKTEIYEEIVFTYTPA